VGENLFVGSHKSQNNRYDAGYIRTFCNLVHEHDLRSDDDFSVIESRMKLKGFDFGRKIEMGVDGNILVYGQRPSGGQ